MKVNNENSRIQIQDPDPDPNPDPLVRGMDPRIRNTDQNTPKFGRYPYRTDLITV